MAELIEGEDGPQTAKEEDDLDPRVKEELDCLNSTAEEINKLEIELDHARTKFRSLLTEATQRLNVLYKKLGRPVTKARPYYELLKESKKAQGEAQRAVVKFHRANGIYRAAKETVALAEERLMSMGDDGEKREFDSAWQEMLNHATMKFMDSEKDKTLSEQEHYKRAGELAEIQKKLKTMEKSMPRTIPRSRPYFELKERLEFQLQQEKLNVEDLVHALQLAKVRYRSALEALEAISEEVHMKRKMANMLPPRTPGVGAENLNDVNSDLPSINLDLSSESAGDVISINSDDFDAMSTDGSEMGDDSPRLEPRSISLPVSPLARDNTSPSFTRARSAAVRAQQTANLSDSLVASGLPRDALRIPPHGEKRCPQYVESSPTLLEQANRLAHTANGGGSTCSSQPTSHPELNGESATDLSVPRTHPSTTPDSFGDGVDACVKSVQNGLESCVLAERPTDKNGTELQPDTVEPIQPNGMDPLGVVKLDNSGAC